MCLRDGKHDQSFSNSGQQHLRRAHDAVFCPGSELEATLRRYLRLSIVVLSVVFCLLASGPLATAQRLPALLDREVFFGEPEITGARISPDGKHVAFLKSLNGVNNIWVKATDEPFSFAKPITSERTEPLGSFLWSQDGKYVLFVKDNDGDGNFNLFAVDVSFGIAQNADSPRLRNLTAAKGAYVSFYVSPKNTPDTVYIGLNDRDRAWPDLYSIHLSSGEKQLIHKNTDRIIGWFFDSNGQLRVAVRLSDNGDREVLRVDKSGSTKIYSSNVLNKCWPYRIAKDGKHVYLWTNKDANLVSLVLLDLETGETQTVATDPLKRAEPGPFLFSEETDQLAMASYQDDRVRRYFRDSRFESDFQWLQRRLAGKEIDVSSRSLDERWWLLNLSSDTEPGEVYLFDRKQRRLTFQYKVMEKLPRTELAAMKTVHYKSSDGLEIPAYLTLSRGIAPRALPAIVLPHGGPWGRDVWGFNAWAQFLANRGYAVLQPNFRGSAGFGREFESAGYGEYGRKMQDDLTWGVKYLVHEGIADPKRVGIIGLSYGGYAALAGVTFTPNLYAAAVDVSGFCDLLKQQENTPAMFEAIRQLGYKQMGDPNTETGRELLRAASPVNFVDQIKTPLMVVHGANDPVVQRQQAEQIVMAVRDRGIPVQYMLLPDEGHVILKQVNNMAVFMAIESFLATQLKGRFQETTTPAVKARLEAITVDIGSLLPSRKSSAQ